MCYEYSMGRSPLGLLMIFSAFSSEEVGQGASVTKVSEGVLDILLKDLRAADSQMTTLSFVL